MDVTLPPDYPVEWETHAVMADGAPVEIRPIRPSDRDRLAAFHQRQSPTSIYYRYFQHRGPLRDEELDHLTQVDYRTRMAFVALLNDQLVAVARYEPYPTGDRPEVAFLVDDGHHGRGLATLMLEYLAAAARARGVPGFVATVLPENHGMLRVFRQAGFDVVTKFLDGLIDVELDIALTPDSSEAISSRASQAGSRSMERLLSPSSIAVVGASREPGAIGHELLRNLQRGGFVGALHAVNRAADEVLGIPCHPSLAAIGEPVDLAVVAVPAAEVDAVVTDAAEIGVSALLVVSSGFAEEGPEGVERERRLVAQARGSGMRLIGPNAFGMVNTAEDVSMRALFLPIAPGEGRVGLASQSGPLGSAVLEHMSRAGIGLSSFVAFGNRADVSVNDLVDFWTGEERTDVITLYVENFGNLRNFARGARAASLAKPVITMRPADSRLDDLLTQSGVVMVDAVSELSEVAELATKQPLPTGRRVVIVSNAASVARLAVAACRRHGLEPVLPASIQHPTSVQHAAGIARVEDALLVADVDAISLAGGASPGGYEELLVAASVSDDVDSVMVALVPNPGLSDRTLRDLITRVDRSINKPMMSVGLVGPEVIAVDGVPTYSFPDEAARTLGRLTDYVEWRKTASTTEGPARWTEPRTDLPEGAEIAAILGDAEEKTITLWSPEATEVVDLLGLPVPSWRLATGPDDVVAAADELGYPVVLKAEDARQRAIGEAGGVAIDLHDPDQVLAAYGRMADDPDVELGVTAVQRMVSAKANVRLGLVQDPDLGAYVFVALGGAAAKQQETLARRYLPLDERSVGELVHELLVAVPLDEESRDVIGAVIGQLGRLANAFPELAKIRLDPFLVAGEDSSTGELEVVLRPWRRDPLSEVRRLESAPPTAQA
ncbi:MAG: GNAT family N-acetyltransferase [Actinomycetota bacterium]